MTGSTCFQVPSASSACHSCPGQSRGTAEEFLRVPAPAEYMPENIIITLLFLHNRILGGSCWATCLLKAFVLLNCVHPSITLYLHSQGGLQSDKHLWEYLESTDFLPVDHARLVSTLSLVLSWSSFPGGNLIRILPFVSTRFFALGDEGSVCSHWDHNLTSKGVTKLLPGFVCVTLPALHPGLTTCLKTTLIPFYM